MPQPNYKLRKVIPNHRISDMPQPNYKLRKVIPDNARYGWKTMYAIT